MSGILVTRAAGLRTTRPRAVFDSVVHPQWAARVADRVRHIGTPFTAIGGTILGGPFDLTTHHGFVISSFVSVIEQGCFLAPVLTEPAQADHIAGLFSEVREQAVVAEFTPPSYAVIAQAADWVRTLAKLASDWSPPHVTSSPTGEVVLEWWKDPRKLTVYVSDDTVDYVMSWGPSLSSDMAEGTATKADQALAIWNWLIRG